mmetsp:Transcript_110271/g.194903  ORF Transcript_110271/g.194903 Transcript_110271/m.194903 type:complete len:297 (+) Transcript_110271:273-1163(+)
MSRCLRDTLLLLRCPLLTMEQHSPSPQSWRRLGVRHHPLRLGPPRFRRIRRLRQKLEQCFCRLRIVQVMCWNIALQVPHQLTLNLAHLQRTRLVQNLVAAGRRARARGVVCHPRSRRMAVWRSTALTIMGQLRVASECGQSFPSSQLDPLLGQIKPHYRMRLSSVCAPLQGPLLIRVAGPAESRHQWRSALLHLDERRRCAGCSLMSAGASASRSNSSRHPRLLLESFWARQMMTTMMIWSMKMKMTANLLNFVDLMLCQFPQGSRGRAQQLAACQLAMATGWPLSFNFGILCNRQ